MMLDECSGISESDKLIRKLRKKLRQIERLEFLGRPLNDEERAKVKQKEKIRRELYQLLETAVQSDVEITPTKAELESGTELIEMSEDSPKPDADFLTTPIENSPAAVTIAEVEAVKPAVNSEEPMEATESNISSQTENEAQSLPKPESLSVPLPSKRSSANCSESSVPNKTANMKRKKCEPPAKKRWIDETQMDVKNLEVHNDLVCCVDMDSDYIISGSRDTLVQVWNAETGTPLQSLRGHSNTVTCVSLLTAAESHNLMALPAETSISPRLALSASTDCCLKLWNITDGTILTSIYTYSGITAMCYCPFNQSCIIGSEGGKLEVYSLSKDQPNPLASQRAFDGPVSSIKLADEQIICCSLDGFISVYKLQNQDKLELSRLFHSECLVPKLGQSISTRPVLSLTLTGSSSDGEAVCYGDEGVNLKILNWKLGEVKKLRNHTNEFGLTNAIYATGSFLLSSSLDVDSGCSTINVRSLPNLSYEGTLAVDTIERVVCIAATQTENGLLKLVVGGSKLTLLEAIADKSRSSPKKCKRVKPVWNKELDLGAEDSADESECSSSSSEDEESDQEDLIEESPSKSSTSWCNLM